MIHKPVLCLLFLEVFGIVMTAPVVTPPNPRNETLDCNEDQSEVYDQRQNGTENYRIHVNGVVVLVAPAETVLQAAQLSNLQMGSEVEASTGAAPVLKPKPKPPSPLSADKVPVESSLQGQVSSSHPKNYKDRDNLKLINLLHMFRSMKPDPEGTIIHPRH